MTNSAGVRHNRKKRRQGKLLCAWRVRKGAGGKPTPTHTLRSGRTGRVDYKNFLGSLGKGKLGKLLRNEARYSFGLGGTVDSGYNPNKKEKPHVSK